MTHVQVGIFSTNEYNVHQVGETYIELQKFKTDVVYTVDLTEIEVLLNNDDLAIIIPDITAITTSDPNKMEPVAKKESKAFLSLFDGKSEDGIKAAVNSWNEMQKKINEEYNDPSSATYQRAEEIAKSHVQELIKNIRVNGDEINTEIYFTHEREEV